MTEDRNMGFIQIWLNYAAHYSRDEQIDILLVCSWVEHLQIDPLPEYEENLLAWSAINIFQIAFNSSVYNFLKRMDELKASPAGIAGAIREMLVKEAGQ